MRRTSSLNYLLVPLASLSLTTLLKMFQKLFGLGQDCLRLSEQLYIYLFFLLRLLPCQILASQGALYNLFLIPNDVFLLIFSYYSFSKDAICSFICALLR